MDHKDDTKALNLNHISIAEKVVHLCAADEHRQNFSLTRAAGAEEIFLPGVHCDVEGAYVDWASEENLQILDLSVFWTGQKAKDRFADEKAWLIDRGWYKKHNFADVNFFNELIVNKTGIRHTYSFIPLHLMADKAIEYKVNIVKADLNKNYEFETDPLLKDINDHIQKNIDKDADFWINDTENKDMLDLRYGYLHFSADFSGVLRVNAPNIIKKNGRYIRQRKMHDG